MRAHCPEQEKVRRGGTIHIVLSERCHTHPSKVKATETCVCPAFLLSWSPQPQLSSRKPAHPAEKPPGTPSANPASHRKGWDFGVSPGVPVIVLVKARPMARPKVSGARKGKEGVKHYKRCHLPSEICSFIYPTCTYGTLAWPHWVLRGSSTKET